MDALLQQLGVAFGGVLSEPLISIGLRVFTIYVIAVWLACALWAFVDMRRRSDHLVPPYLTAVAIVLATPLLFPLVLLVHVILRPRSIRAERRMERLRDRAMERDLDDVSTCLACRRLVDPDWLVCPHCRTSLAHLCDRCGHPAPTAWGACAWCGASFDAPVEALSPAR